MKLIQSFQTICQRQCPVILIVIIIPFVVSCFAKGGGPLIRKVDIRVKCCSDDTALYRFLDDLTLAIEKHNWKAVLNFFNSDNYAAQRRLGVGTEQYLLEGFNLKGELFNEWDEGVEFSRLNAIKEVVLSKKELMPDSPLIIIHGIVTLHSGARTSITLYVQKNESGEYELYPPLG
jgi:hypothetical protein